MENDANGSLKGCGFVASGPFVPRGTEVTGEWLAGRKDLVTLGLGKQNMGTPLRQNMQEPWQDL